MRLLAWLDGGVFEAEKLRVDLPFVMQRIHTLAGKAYNVERHVDVLRRASEELFGFASLCSARDVQRIIGRLVELSRVSTMLSVPVAMRLDAEGSLSFEVEQPTFGTGGYLRAKRESGVPYVMPQPVIMAQTKASIAMDDMADYAVVERMFAERFPHTPKVFLLAPVCRPGWLIEMECMAVKTIHNDQYKPY